MVVMQGFMAWFRQDGAGSGWMASEVRLSFDGHGFAGAIRAKKFSGLLVNSLLNRYVAIMIRMGTSGRIEADPPDLATAPAALT